MVWLPGSFSCGGSSLKAASPSNGSLHRRRNRTAARLLSGCHQGLLFLWRTRSQGRGGTGGGKKLCSPLHCDHGRCPSGSAFVTPLPEASCQMLPPYSMICQSQRLRLLPLSNIPTQLLPLLPAALPLPRYPPFQTVGGGGVVVYTGRQTEISPTPETIRCLGSLLWLAS